MARTEQALADRIHKTAVNPGFSIDKKRRELLHLGAAVFGSFLLPDTSFILPNRRLMLQTADDQEELGLEPNVSPDTPIDDSVTLNSDALPALTLPEDEPKVYKSYGDLKTLFIDYSARPKKYDISIVSNQEEQRFFDLYSQEISKPNNKPTWIHLVDMDHPRIRDFTRDPNHWFPAGRVAVDDTLLWVEDYLPFSPETEQQAAEYWIAFNEDAFDPFYLVRMHKYVHWQILYVLQKKLTIGMIYGSWRDNPALVSPMWGNEYFTIEWSPVDDPSIKRRLDRYDAEYNSNTLTWNIVYR